MRDDVKANLKRIKQQLLAFCLRHGWVYSETKHYWTQVHLKWLEQLKLEGVYQEVLDGYLIELKHLMETIDRYDKRIEGLSQRDIYREPVNQLTCFLGVKRPTALSVLVEVGDFRRFPSAERFAAYLGIVPGEHSSSDSRNRLGITKAGNGHIRRLLVEAAQSYARGKVGYKSKVLIKRQEGNSAKVIAYADRANERLRRKYFQMMYRSKHSNVAKTAVARELACFMWGMMTGRIE
jgi:transposase